MPTFRSINMTEKIYTMYMKTGSVEMSGQTFATNRISSICFVLFLTENGSRHSAYS